MSSSTSIVSIMVFHIDPSTLRQTNTRVFLFSLMLSFSLVVGLFGQQAASTAPPINQGTPSQPQEVYRSDTVIRVHSDLVLIPVTVTDRSGKTVSGLEKEHFQLFEDTAQQDIIHFVAEDLPASIGIVFDTSGSMQPKLSKAREAVYTLLDSAKAGDEFFLVRFSTEARTIVPMSSRFGDIRNEVAALSTSGSTALLDGVRLGMAEMKHAHNMRKTIVIISDGEDNSSHWTVPELKAAVREEDILIYAISIGSHGAYSDCQYGQRCGSSLLREIANHTGGRLFEIDRVKDLPGVATKISSWLRNQYVLGYMPIRSERDGTYRKVQLKVTRPKGYPRLNAVWRQGYQAPKD